MSRLSPRTGFDPGTGCHSGERGSSEPTEPPELPCFNLEPEDQIIRTASSTSQQKKQINFLSHTFLHATMIDLRRQLFADARVKMKVEFGALAVSIPGSDVYTASRCRCHDGLGNAIWASGSWQRMSRAESRSNNRWGYCGDGVWRRGIGERRNPVSRNAKSHCDWLGVAR